MNNTPNVTQPTYKRPQYFAAPCGDDLQPLNCPKKKTRLLGFVLKDWGVDRTESKPRFPMKDNDPFEKRLFDYYCTRDICNSVEEMYTGPLTEEQQTAIRDLFCDHFLTIEQKLMVIEMGTAILEKSHKYVMDGYTVSAEGLGAYLLVRLTRYIECYADKGLAKEKLTSYFNEIKLAKDAQEFSDKCNWLNKVKEQPVDTPKPTFDIELKPADTSSIRRSHLTIINLQDLPIVPVEQVTVSVRHVDGIYNRYFKVMSKVFEIFDKQAQRLSQEDQNHLKRADLDKLVVLETLLKIKSFEDLAEGKYTGIGMQELVNLVYVVELAIRSSSKVLSECFTDSERKQLLELRMGLPGGKHFKELLPEIPEIDIEAFLTELNSKDEKERSLAFEKLMKVVHSEAEQTEKDFFRKVLVDNDCRDKTTVRLLHNLYAAFNLPGGLETTDKRTVYLDWMTLFFCKIWHAIAAATSNDVLPLFNLLMRKYQKELSADAKMLIRMGALFLVEKKNVPLVSEMSDEAIIKAFTERAGVEFNQEGICIVKEVLSKQMGGLENLDIPELFSKLTVTWKSGDMSENYAAIFLWGRLLEAYSQQRDGKVDRGQYLNYRKMIKDHVPDEKARRVLLIQYGFGADIDLPTAPETSDLKTISHIDIETLKKSLKFAIEVYSPGHNTKEFIQAVDKLKDIAVNAPERCGFTENELKAIKAAFNHINNIWDVLDDGTKINLVGSGFKSMRQQFTN